MNPFLIFDVMRFELSRSMTAGRIAIWLVLVAFPVGLISLLKLISGFDQPEVWGFTVYFLVPEVVCMLGLLLWATPVVATEIEGQTWIYLAMRQSGRTTVLLGKYMTSIVWTFAAAVAGITLSMMILIPDDVVFVWAVMCALAGLSCFAHAAIYLLIGVVFHSRTMVTAVVYTLVIEYGLSFVPAVANKLTVNYRLRGLLVEWMDWETVKIQARVVFGDEPASTHLFAIGTFTAICLTAAVIRLSTAEYPTQQDG